MTNVELLAMPAGRELDRIVAERVMELPAKSIRLCGTDECVEVWTDNPFYADGICNRRDVQGVCDPPSYSTDIAAAWKVVERMHECGHAIVLERWLDMPSKNKWSALFIMENGHDTGQRVAESAPLAICRAALVAAGMGRRRS